MSWFSPWFGLRELPELDADHMTNVPGLYVAGDLGDAPVIKAALRQGAEVAAAVATALGFPANAEDAVDVVIVGAGPAGVSAAKVLTERGFRVVVLERDQPFHTLASFPRGKVLYADPPRVAPPAGFAFDDGPSEALVASWGPIVADLRVESGVSVTAIDGADGAFVVRGATATGERRFPARKVIVAVGRRGTQRPLGVPGEALARRTLDDPNHYRGRTVAVIGAGDTAAEWATLLDDAGARVTLVARGKLTRPKPKNRERLRASTVTVRASTTVTAIQPDRVITTDGEIPADDVFVAIGTELPLPLLRALGVRLRQESAWERARWLTLAPMFAAVFAFYALKQGRALFPFDRAPFADLARWLDIAAPSLPTADGHLRHLDAGFFGTLAYSLVVLVAGVAAMRRHPDPWQRRRYLSLIGFQLVFLFGVPELIAPAIVSVPSGFYSAVVPWPLSVWSLTHGPGEVGWLIVGALTAFVAIPLFVRRYNESFCSWLCGCGGLAETFGDLWRWRAPRGDLARKFEHAGKVVFVAATLVTAIIIADAWQLVRPTLRMDHTVTLAHGVATIPASEDEIRVASAEYDGHTWRFHLEERDADRWHPGGFANSVQVGDVWTAPTEVTPGEYTLDAPPDATVRWLAKQSALGRVPDFARGWYGLMVDFWLAGVIGVALYPYLGNRVWCRFFCPLRAWMEFLAKRIGRLAIVVNDKCISCGECTRYCQMGIDVQGFAEQGQAFDNRATACIQCGVCVEVCPVDALSLVDKTVALPGVTLPEAPIGPRWGV